MRWVYLLAAALAAATGPAAAQEAQPQVGVIKGWPAQSPWVTLLVGLPDGKAICTSATQLPPFGPSGYTLAFVLGDGRTHFYLTLSDRAKLEAQTLQLVSDAGPFQDMPVIGRQPELGTTISDIPSDNFIKRIVPELLKRQTVTLRAGDRSFAVPHDNFAAVLSQISECADEYRKRFGEPR